MAIQRQAPSNVVEDWCGKLTLPQLVVLISQCSIGITNDSGGIHLLAALKRPGIAISNCFSLGFFHPYPKEISDFVSFVYPDVFYASSVPLRERKGMYGGTDHYEITEVSVESVITRMEAMLHPPFHDPVDRLNG